jgi:glutaminyl-peptide cyclotransferase
MAPRQLVTVGRAICCVALLVGCSGGETKTAAPHAQDTTSASAGGIPTYGVTVVHRWPHNPNAFTEGLEIHDGLLYEATGLVGQSGITISDPSTGSVLHHFTLAPPYFGEGITVFRGRLYELTWTTGIGFIYDTATFVKRGSFTYSGEGWGMTHDSVSLIMSDGTNVLRFLNPATLHVESALSVTAAGLPVIHLNELEWIKGQIWANVWQTPQIARIDPKTGAVVAWIDLTSILPSGADADSVDVANGIAYDSAADRIFVTGKRWPVLFEIKPTTQ